MMPLHMLILEVGVEYFRMGHHAQHFVVRFTSVDEFVASLRLHGADEPYEIPEYQVLWPSDWSDPCQIVGGELDILAEEAE